MTTAKVQASDPLATLRGIGDARPRYREWSRHPKAQEYIFSSAKQGVVKCGRRGAKTLATAEKIVRYFLGGRRVTYGTPTSEQLDTCWRECKRILQPMIDVGILKKNETEHIIEVEDTEQRLHCKTIFNADTMRGTYGDLFLDEWQLCDEMAWEEVGAPMLADRNSDVYFIFTPPSPHASGISRARDPLHATKLFASALEEERRAREQGRPSMWQTFHWTSHDNGYLSLEGLEKVTLNMSQEAYRREVLAEDDDISPNLLIYRAFNEQSQLIESFRIPETWPRYVGHDFGGANPAALFFAQDPATGYFYAYQEYFPGRGLSTYQHVLAFKELTQGVTVRKRAGGSHQEDEIRQGYTAQGWPIQEPKIRDVNAGIDRVRAMMEKNQIFVLKTLLRLRHELSTYLWKQDADGRITDEIYNKSAFHLCDCMRGILSDFTPERVASVKQGPLYVPSLGGRAS